MKPPPIFRRVESFPYQALAEKACPGAVDRPHRARLYGLTFWVQNYWGRWAHARKCIADLRWNGKVRCSPDCTYETTAARGLEEALCRSLDSKCPAVFFKTPLLGFFLLWLLAGLGMRPTWEDSPPKPQRKKIETFGGGIAPFHRIARPDDAEERRLVKRAKAGDVIARNMLIAGHLWITEKAARRFRGWLDDENEIDDLKQAAAEALFRALDDFDPKTRRRFSTFAWAVIKNDLRDWLRKERKLKRHASAELIAEKNKSALGLYASNLANPSVEYKIFSQLFEKTQSRSA
jgi:RNA polymerase sigma factor (sigma-70 family)